MTHSPSSESHHGVLMNIDGQGVFIKGEPGIGKSSLALALLYQGHQLIADDIAEFEHQQEHIIGHCPPLLSGLLHSRELGLIPVRELFGKAAWQAETTLRYVILLHQDHTRISNQNLTPPIAHYTICQHNFPMLPLCSINPASLTHRIQTWLALQSHQDEVNNAFIQQQQQAIALS
jgi:HPr kinase/phosphorylase